MCGANAFMTIFKTGDQVTAGTYKQTDSNFKVTLPESGPLPAGRNGKPTQFIAYDEPVEEQKVIPSGIRCATDISGMLDSLGNPGLNKASGIFGPQNDDLSS